MTFREWLLLAALFAGYAAFILSGGVSSNGIVAPATVMGENHQVGVHCEYKETYGKNGWTTCEPIMLEDLL